MTEQTLITLLLTTADNELFLKYQGQTKEQNAYLSLDLETGKLSAYVDSGICPLTPARAFHGVDQEWKIPALKVEGLKALMNAVKNDCQTIINDSVVKWDGSNYIGTLGTDANQAYDRIGSLIEDCWDCWPTWQSWDAADWFCESLQTEETDESRVIIKGREDHFITSKTTDEEIEKLAEKLEQEIKEDHEISLMGVESYFLSLRDDLRDDEEDDE